MVKKWPLMCMEFWDGWFNRWGEPGRLNVDPEELADAVMEAIEIGSRSIFTCFTVVPIWFYEWLFRSETDRFTTGYFI